jgi:uridine kinase
VDYVRFRHEVLEKLAAGQAPSYRKYDCQTGKLTDPITVSANRLTVIEGVYSMHPSLARFYDLKVFLQIEPATQSNRILKRTARLYTSVLWANGSRWKTVILKKGRSKSSAILFSRKS